MAFRYPCYRDFKSYAGRVSAIYELIVIAVRDFESSAKRADNEEGFIEESAAKFGLNVHFSGCPNLVAEVLSLHIVNVHEAFERFFRSLRAEAATLVSLEWKDYEKKDHLWIAIQNAFGNQRKGRETFGKMKVDLCGYYRLIRNAATHSDRDPEALTERFSGVKDYRDDVVRLYETIVAAPNAPDALTRNDFQLFVRITQDIAWGFSEKLRPTDDQICSAVGDVASVFKERWPGKPSRVHTAIVTYLRKNYGISNSEADTIAKKVH